MIVALHKSVEELYRTEIDFIDSNNGEKYREDVEKINIKNSEWQLQTKS